MYKINTTYRVHFSDSVRPDTHEHSTIPWIDGLKDCLDHFETVRHMSIFVQKSNWRKPLTLCVSSNCTYMYDTMIITMSHLMWSCHSQIKAVMHLGI